MLVECPAGESPRRARQRLRPLQTFRKEIEKRKRGRRRTNRVALFPNRYEQETLFDNWIDICKAVERAQL
jgi:hypothetical protein